jgi:hypothetical protein
MRTVPFGPATSHSGKPRTLTFTTSIPAEQAPGWQHSEGKALAVIPADAPQVIAPSYDQLIAAGGDKFESTVAEWAQNAARAKVRVLLTNEFRKLVTPPSDPAAFAVDVSGRITVQSLFEEGGRRGRKPVVKIAKTDLEAVLSASNLSDAEKLARFMQMAGLS